MLISKVQEARRIGYQLGVLKFQGICGIEYAAKLDEAELLYNDNGAMWRQFWIGVNEGYCTASASTQFHGYFDNSNPPF